MKTFLLALLLMGNFLTASAAGPIGSLTNVNTVSVGGFIFNVKDPSFRILAIGNSNLSYSTFRTQDGTPYQVPGGKVFHVYAAEIYSPTTQAQGSVCYGTTDVGLNSALAPSGLAYAYGDESPARILQFGTTSEFKVGQYPYDFKIPTGDYGCFHNPSTANTTVKLYGYEE